MTSIFEDLIGIGVLLVVFVGFYLKSTGKTIGQLITEIKEAFK